LEHDGHKSWLKCKVTFKDIEAKEPNEHSTNHTTHLLDISAGTDNYSFLAPVMRALMEKSYELLNLNTFA